MVVVKSKKWKLFQSLMYHNFYKFRQFLPIYSKFLRQWPSGSGSGNYMTHRVVLRCCGDWRRSYICRWNCVTAIDLWLTDTSTPYPDWTWTSSSSTNSRPVPTLPVHVVELVSPYARFSLLAVVYEQL